MAVDYNEAKVLHISHQLTEVATMPLNSATTLGLKRKQPHVISTRHMSSFESCSPVDSDLLANVISHPNLNDAKPIAIELCSGSARLSSQLNASGFQAIPVDWQRNAFQECCPTVKLDLADDQAVCVLTDVINAGHVVVMTAAVPCGTCSRAREIPLAASLLKGRKAPSPLRSAEFPMG